MGHNLSSIVAAASALLAASGAMAAEYCVACSGPDAVYRCEVGGDANDARAWLTCITELARQGGHDSCSVDRKMATPCPGVHKVLQGPAGPAPARPAVQMAKPVPGAGPGAGPPPVPPAMRPGPAQTAALPPAVKPGEPEPKRVPQTMKELADDTFEASKEGLKKAGDKVSSTVTEGAKKAGDAVSDGAKAAGDGLSKAGDAVGEAAKKTWHCVTSLFQSC